MGWTGRPHRNWSGTSDSNRDSLGPRPSGLIRFPSPRNTKHQSVGLEPNERSSVRKHAHDECTLWGDRRESNPRGQIHGLPPKPLGHAWCQEHESNVLVRLFAAILKNEPNLWVRKNEPNF